ncbi:hypothetical protein [Flavobacterium hydatis]|uniref:Alpha/beta hydrolase n=1 Tax=Flavobacterium hydatis TaxID=991 RepID=A0A086AP56_FLAHY|nr:hypothetical protein [Flavobacterium hydatis]KFF18470.1 hypothetical protein IW20_06135 [Flavobacterium hydatis]OXA96782.1 hypothetical protein B0A62_05895 [Flavobacterium hydatis]
MKPRLLILSDLFGGKNPEWIKMYSDLLESKFDIQYYDVLELGGIDISNFEESNLHNQFLSGGIDKAVDTLLQLEKGKVIILGMSIGGTIAWKASLKGLNTIRFFAVSSTRLRYETESPNCELKLYFGEKDSNKPNSQWFLDLKIPNKILQNQNHQLYLEKNNASLICNEILAI